MSLARIVDAMPQTDVSTTVDTLMPWGLTVRQSRTGFRFGLEAILLSSMVELGPGEIGVELGAGTAVVSLVLARRFPQAGALVAIEVEDEAATLASANVRANGERRVHVVRADYARMTLRREVDVVFGNPPYHRTGTGRPSRDPRRALAKSELRATLADTVAAAARLLRDEGRLYLIYPAARRQELVVTLAGFELSPTHLKLVIRKEGQAPGYVMLEARKGAAETTPRVEWMTVLDSTGAYTDSAARAYGYPEARAMERGGRRPGAETASPHVSVAAGLSC